MKEAKFIEGFGNLFQKELLFLGKVIFVFEIPTFFVLFSFFAIPRRHV